MKATWQPWLDQPMYLRVEREYLPGDRLRRYRGQTSIFMRRWRVIPLDFTGQLGL